MGFIETKKATHPIPTIIRPLMAKKSNGLSIIVKD